jgi:hypothetical protein
VVKSEYELWQEERKRVAQRKPWRGLRPGEGILLAFGTAPIIALILIALKVFP